MLAVKRWTSMIGILGVVLVAGSVTLPSEAVATITPLRTVMVVDPQHVPALPIVQSRLCGTTARCDNGRDGIAVVMLLSGKPPPTPTVAKVLTDTSCDPDRRGISHCLNILQLRGGGVLTVRHDHDMMAYPCLTPGEFVQVTAFGGFR